MAEIYLRRALRQKGCPLCRCVAEAERRYLWFLLHESVNDVGTRRRLAQSLGLCARHGPLMLTMEIEEWDTPLGNSIIYEGLASQVLQQVKTARALLARRQHQPWWQRMQRLGPGRAVAPERALAPDKMCRACEIGQESAKIYGETLADMMALTEFQELYAASDSVCLPHLRLIVQVAQRSPGLDYLLEQAEVRLAALRDALKTLQDDICAAGKDGSANDFHAVEEAVSFFGAVFPTPSHNDRPVPIKDEKGSE